MAKLRDLAAQPEITAPQVLTLVAPDGALDNDQGGDVYAKYRRMRRDPTIALARDLIMAPVLVSDWKVESRDDAPEGAKDFISDQMMPIRLHLLRTAIAGGVDFGWQPYEKVFAVREGRIVLHKLKALLQDLTTIVVVEKTGAFAGLRQDRERVSLELERCLLLSMNVEGTDWYGEPLMIRAEQAYDEWLVTNDGAKRYDAKIAGSHWVVHYPIGTSTIGGQEVDNFQVAQNLLSTMEASGAIAVPRWLEDFVDDVTKDKVDAWRIELLTDSGNAKASFVDRQRYLDALKVRAFGLPERAVLEGEFGTKAEAEAHASFAITGMELRHRLICQDLNWHLVNQLLRLNWGPDAESTVYIEPVPLTDPALLWLRKLYLTILSNPESFMTELDTIDSENLKDKVGVPTVPETDVDEAGQIADTQPGLGLLSMVRSSLFAPVR